MKRLALLVVVGLVAAGCGTKTVTVTTTQTTVTTTPAGPVACTAADLSASFDVQPGSAGAGNITYVLKLTNTSTTCVFTPSIFQLLDAKGGDVPTHAAPAEVPKNIPTGGSISYEARFSPDVPGTGDNTSGACEPVSSTLRITVGSGTVDAPIKPPTSVCEQGSMQFRPPTS